MFLFCIWNWLFGCAYYEEGLPFLSSTIGDGFQVERLAGKAVNFSPLTYLCKSFHFTLYILFGESISEYIYNAALGMVYLIMQKSAKISNPD